jgi:hypothetical protein
MKRLNLPAEGWVVEGVEVAFGLLKRLREVEGG